MAEQTAVEQPKGLPAHKRDDLKWKKGQSGNPKGRPKGSRAKLSEKFCKALLKDFKDNGEAAIETMRRERPNEYAKMIAGILTQEVDVSGSLTLKGLEWRGVEPDK